MRPARGPTNAASGRPEQVQPPRKAAQYAKRQAWGLFLPKPGPRNRLRQTADATLALNAAQYARRQASGFILPKPGPRNRLRRAASAAPPRGAAQYAKRQAWGLYFNGPYASIGKTPTLAASFFMPTI